MSYTPLITLCMIVKNEARMIQRCLESARDIAGQLVVVDTGSDDATPELAANAGAEVYHHPWRGHFSESRNHSISYARGTWILILDGDELLDPKTAHLIGELDLSERGPDAYAFQIMNFTTDRALESEAGVISQVRLFRNQPSHRYNGLVHNQLQDVQREVTLDGPSVPIRVLHYGYTPTVWAAQNKDDRIQLHERAVADQPEDHFVRYNYGNHLKILGRHREALTQFMLAVPPREVTGYARSEDTLDDLLPELSWGLAACFLGAFCANKVREHEVALELTREALERAPHLLDARVRRAETLIALTRYQEAITTLEEGLALNNPLVIKQRALYFDAPYRLGRARFLRGERAESAPTFASLLPQCDDVTVLTHLCLGALTLGVPALWRYARARGAALAPGDPDWTIVDQDIMRAEMLPVTLPTPPPLIASELWCDQLRVGLGELCPELTASLWTMTPQEEELILNETPHELYLKLTDHPLGARLSLMQRARTLGESPKGRRTTEPSEVYTFSERYASLERALPIESATLLLSQLCSLSATF